MKRNNGKMKKAMAGVMATTMMLSLAACGNKETAEVPADENKALANTDQAKNGDLTDTIEDAMGLSTNTDADKDETVYVIAEPHNKVFMIYRKLCGCHMCFSQFPLYRWDS